MSTTSGGLCGRHPAGWQAAVTLADTSYIDLLPAGFNSISRLGEPILMNSLLYLFRALVREFNRLSIAHLSLIVVLMALILVLKLASGS